MSMFILLRKICHRIKTSMSKFWWGRMNKENGISWQKWKSLGDTKFQGGLGFRDIMAFNKALLAKQIWRLIQYPTSLASQILKAKYYPRSTVLATKVGRNPTLIWHSISSSIDLIREGTLWRIGNGQQVNIWKDNWLPKHITHKVQSPVKLLLSDAKVSELICPDTKSWRSELIFQIFELEEAQTICMPLYGDTDRLTWWPAKSGTFSVKSAYFLELQRNRRGSTLKKLCSWRLMEKSLETQNPIPCETHCLEGLPWNFVYKVQPQKKEMLGSEYMSYLLRGRRDHNPCVMGLPSCLGCVGGSY